LGDAIISCEKLSAGIIAANVSTAASMAEYLYLFLLSTAIRLI